MKPLYERLLLFQMRVVATLKARMLKRSHKLAETRQSDNATSQALDARASQRARQTLSKHLYAPIALRQGACYILIVDDERNGTTTTTEFECAKAPLRPAPEIEPRM